MKAEALSVKSKGTPCPKYKIGTKIVKHFPNHGWFNGTVKSISPPNDDPLYKIHYKEDDDEEELVTLEMDLYSIGMGMDMDIDKGIEMSNQTFSLRKSLFYIHQIDESKFKKKLKFNHPKKSIHINNNTDTTTNVRMISHQEAEFYLFLYERQNIWRSRQIGIITRPWSYSPMLNAKKYCNVYRELDRGTAFFHSHLLNLMDSIRSTQDNNHTPKDSTTSSSVTMNDWTKHILWTSYHYRLVNRSTTFETIGFCTPDTLHSFLKRATKFKSKGNAFFTNAHQTTNFKDYKLYLNKVAAAATDGDGGSSSSMLDDIAQKICNARNDLKECVSLVRELPGVGPFLSWQIICDLDEAGCIASLEHCDFCEFGPGAKHGLELIYSFSKKGKSPSLSEYTDFAIHLRNQQEQAFQQLGIDFPYLQQYEPQNIIQSKREDATSTTISTKDLSITKKTIGLKELEHSLCEFSKFKRLQSNLLYEDDIYVPYRVENEQDCRVCNRRISAVEAMRDGWTCPTCFHFTCMNCVASSSSNRENSADDDIDITDDKKMEKNNRDLYRCQRCLDFKVFVANLQYKKDTVIKKEEKHHDVK